MNKKILFLTPYPGDTAGSQRFRFEQYLSSLEAHGYSYDCQSFLDQNTWEVLYKDGYAFRKMFGILAGFLRRTKQLFKLSGYDYVFIHREAAPLGPPLIEWCIAKIWRKRLIFDFDDAIWMPNTSAQNSLASKLKFPNKTGKIISWSYKVSAGNQFLMEYARIHNGRVVYNPTTIDTVNRHVPDHDYNNPLVIGWTGTHSTLKYLEIIREPLIQLAKQTSFEFIVIADKAPDNPLPNQRFIQWDKATEIIDLNNIDIGLMPLEDNPWAKGKCGFKALQFMALETPVLVSPVGVNKEIVEPEIHGFHCKSTADWLEKLKLLLEDESLRKRLGTEGRKKVIQSFSVESNRKNFIDLFE